MRMRGHALGMSRYNGGLITAEHWDIPKKALDLVLNCCPPTHPRSHLCDFEDMINKNIHGYLEDLQIECSLTIPLLSTSFTLFIRSLRSNLILAFACSSTMHPVHRLDIRD